jgi:hypothetical protein
VVLQGKPHWPELSRLRLKWYYNLPLEVGCPSRGDDIAEGDPYVFSILPAVSQASNPGPPHWNNTAGDNNALRRGKNGAIRPVWWYIPIIPATQEVEKGRTHFKTSPGKKLMRSYLKNKLGMIEHFCSPAAQDIERGESQPSQSKPSPGRSVRTYL